MSDHEPELLPHERAALQAWADRDPPADFADEVLARWDAECEADDEAAVPEPEVLAERRALRLAWWIGMTAAAAAIALALGLSWSTRPDRLALELVAASPELTALRSDARGTLLRNCTPCHLASAEGAEPKALAVFDLAEPSWYTALAPDQLAAAVDRMAEDVDAVELAGFRRYVDAELAHRGAAAR